jgi:hypothetical protein
MVINLPGDRYDAVCALLTLYGLMVVDELGVECFQPNFLIRVFCPIPTNSDQLKSYSEIKEKYKAINSSWLYE